MSDTSTKKTNFQKSEFSGISDSRKSFRFPEIWISGNPELQISGIPGFPHSGIPELRKSGMLFKNLLLGLMRLCFLICLHGSETRFELSEPDAGWTNIPQLQLSLLVRGECFLMAEHKQAGWAYGSSFKLPACVQTSGCSEVRSSGISKIRNFRNSKNPRFQWENMNV